MDEIFINKNQLNEIIYNLKNNKSILLQGPSGSGKTLFLNLIYKNLYPNGFFINQENTMREINEYSKSLKYNKIIIIDDIEIYDKCVITFIKTHLLINNFPLLISLTTKIKIAEKINIKNIISINIDYPTLDQIKILFKNKFNNQILENIYEKTQGCIRDINLNLNFKYLKQDNDNNTNLVELNEFKNKNNYEIMNIIIKKNFKYNNLNNIYNLLEITELLYENINTDIKNYNKINNNFIILNELENYMLKNLEWNFYNEIQKMKIMSIINNKIKYVTKSKKPIIKNIKKPLINLSIDTQKDKKLSSYEIIMLCERNINIDNKYYNNYIKTLK